MAWGTPGAAGEAAARLLDPVINPASDGGNSQQDSQSGAWAIAATKSQAVEQKGA